MRTQNPVACSRPGAWPRLLSLHEVTVRHLGDRLHVELRVQLVGAAHLVLYKRANNEASTPSAHGLTHTQQRRQPISRMLLTVVVETDDLGSRKPGDVPERSTHSASDIKDG